VKAERISFFEAKKERFLRNEMVLRQRVMTLPDGRGSVFQRLDYPGGRAWVEPVLVRKWWKKREKEFFGFVN